jgi:hypothetical protein
MIARAIDGLLCRLHWCRRVHIKKVPTQYYYVMRCERCGHIHDEDV